MPKKSKADKQAAKAAKKAAKASRKGGGGGFEMDMPFGGSDEEDGGGREMKIPASSPAKPKPKPQAAPKKPAVSAAQKKARATRPPVKAGKADVRPTCFDSGVPDTQGSYTSPCEKFWMGETCISEVDMKRFPGETSWTARTAMLTAPDLTFRDPSNKDTVLNTIRRMDVKTDGGVVLQSNKTDPNQFDAADCGFKITAGSGDNEVVFLIKFKSPPAGKQTQQQWQGCFKSNGWESFA